MTKLHWQGSPYLLGTEVTNPDICVQLTHLDIVEVHCYVHILDNK